jgi:hypothetical protein
MADQLHGASTRARRSPEITRAHNRSRRPTSSTASSQRRWSCGWLSADLGNGAAQALTADQQAAHLRLQHVIQPGLDQLPVAGAARHHPAIQPGQRPLARYHIADVGPGGTQQAQLLRPVIGQHQGNAMAAEQLDRLLRLRIETEHVAPQLDQPLDRRPPLLGGDAEGLLGPEAEQRQGKIVHAAVVGQHPAAQFRIPERLDRIRR